MNEHTHAHIKSSWSHSSFATIFFLDFSFFPFVSHRLTVQWLWYDVERPFFYPFCCCCCFLSHFPLPRLDFHFIPKILATLISASLSLFVNECILFENFNISFTSTKVRSSYITIAWLANRSRSSLGQPSIIYCEVKVRGSGGLCCSFPGIMYEITFSRIRSLIQNKKCTIPILSSCYVSYSHIYGSRSKDKEATKFPTFPYRHTCELLQAVQRLGKC